MSQPARQLAPRGHAFGLDHTIALFHQLLGHTVEIARQLADFIQESARRRDPVVVCGDFNAGPDADEVRMLTGRMATAAPGLVFYDAWEMAGDGTPGLTWSNQNSLAAVALYPDRRLDYVFSAWPRLGGAGHPTRCERLGVLDADVPQLSDHYGVVAELRY